MGLVFYKEEGLRETGKIMEASYLILCVIRFNSLQSFDLVYESHFETSE